MLTVLAGNSYQQEERKEVKTKNNQHEPQLSPSMMEDKATEELKKRMRDFGRIVNAGADKATKPRGKKKGGKK